MDTFEDIYANFSELPAMRQVAIEMHRTARAEIEAGFLVEGFRPSASDYELVNIGVKAGIAACFGWLHDHHMLVKATP